jgi:YD repeat-containing protein
MGNWVVIGGSPVYLTNTASPTGTKYYTFTGTTLQKTGLNSGDTYIVSYWSSTGSNYTVTGTISSTKTGATIGGWTYVEHEITGASSVSVSGTGSIDELRLYPKGALMTTYTYLPLAGVTSQCDAGNHITYYEYDSLGRLTQVKDEKRKILKTLDYRYK